jgi:hypothetical protein
MFTCSINGQCSAMLIKPSSVIFSHLTTENNFRFGMFSDSSFKPTNYWRISYTCANLGENLRLLLHYGWK